MLNQVIIKTVEVISMLLTDGSIEDVHTQRKLSNVMQINCNHYNL